MKVIWAPRAIVRASQIAASIAVERPGAVAKWVDQVFAAVATLRNPRRGRKVPEVNRPEIRELLHRSYRIIYRLDPRRTVLTIRHGRRQWDPAELESDE